ncbi:adhesin [Pseudomonas palleroniana]|uniref:Adhesin n=2 Tax=Pseudomonas palleroniana TaxID=191390 RepID=A0A0X7K5U2_9PSED|nr:adhesin [Pseudomonas palleroniana]
MRAIFTPQALAVAVALGCCAQAQAVSFNIGEVEGQFDSSLSVGASWGMRDADKKLVGVPNGGTGQASTGDDGRLNFKKGETFSKIFKGIHDLELKYGDSGVFVRGKYWYDFELQDEDREFKPISNNHRDEGARSSGYELLDAFVYHNYSIGDLPGAVRVGKQVVSWGESTFIGNSINSINPIDVSAFRRPGAEIKEGLIPVNMLFASQSLTNQLSVEGFYQLNWENTVVDNCGTFFGNDVVAHGCNNNYTVGSPAIAPLQPVAAAFGQGFQVTREGVVVQRAKDRDARDGGQFGAALRWLGDDTEYGLYFMNYHSRTPTVGTITANTSLATIGRIANAANAIAPGSGAGLAQSTMLGRGQYYLDYPEDIRLYGASFSTTLPTGTAWTGEISYRPNAPVQLNTTDLTLALVNPIAGNTASPIRSSFGSDNSGYRRKEITQIQSTMTQFFDQVLGAERLTLVGEAAFVHVGGLEAKTKLRYGRDSVFGAYGFQGDTDGFVTANSWGYRARAILDYNNVFAGVNLKPNLSWSHDVSGYGPNGIFNEGAKAISVGVDADYRNTYTASLSYTDFFGGDYNTLTDRDFIALSFGVNF